MASEDHDYNENGICNVCGSGKTTAPCREKRHGQKTPPPSKERPKTPVGSDSSPGRKQTPSSNEGRAEDRVGAPDQPSEELRRPSLLYAQYLPAVGAILGALFFLFIADNSEAGELMRRGAFRTAMVQSCQMAFLGAIIGAAVSLILAVILRMMTYAPRIPNPLRGWLLVFALWFTLSPALHLVSVLNNLIMAAESIRSARVRDQSPELTEFILTLDLVNSALLLLLASIACASFFARSKRTAILGRIYFVAGLGYAVLRPVLAGVLEVPDPIHSQLVLFMKGPWILPILLWTALGTIWTLSFRTSEQVRLTFNLRTR